MSIRWRNGKPIVEIYDPATRRKRHVKPSEHGMGDIRTERQARQLERLALADRDADRGDLIGVFAARWARDYPRGESTNIHNTERVKKLASDFPGRTLASLTREEAIEWATENPQRVPAARAMFTDAVSEGLVKANPFRRLGNKKSRGRADVTVLTPADIDSLAHAARDVHPGPFGVEFASMIVWAAYTCMRPGEVFAARYSLLAGDTYDLRAQFNSRLRREAPPKHGGDGMIYAPQPAQRAVLDKPRRLGDDLMFRTKRGHQFREGSLHHAWVPVRAAFGRPTLTFHELRHAGAAHMLNDLELEPWVIAEQLRHKDGGTLVTQLYGHPDRRRAIERIRRAFVGGSIAAISSETGDSRGTRQRKGAG